jgi:uncharacterized protein (TIGR03435 family)
MRATAISCLALPALLLGPTVHAQNTPSNARAITFEVASVKERTTPTDGSFVGRRPGGRFAAENATLREILEYAYEIQRFQLVGSLAPIDSARWDITATLGSAAAGAAERDAILQAVRALLADRFAMSLHRETRTLPVYALRLARADGTPGPSLTKSATDCPALMAALRAGGGPPPAAAQRCGFRGRIGRLESSGMPLSDLGLALAGRLGRPVVDQTGLAGTWDLRVTYAADRPRFPRVPSRRMRRRPHLLPTRRRSSRPSRSSSGSGSCPPRPRSTCSWSIACRVPHPTEPR